MGEIEKLLYECERRMEETSDLIMQNMNEDAGKALVEELLESAKVMDEIKFKARREQSALENCKTLLSQAEEPWNINIREIFEEQIKKSTDKRKQKKHQELHDVLKKHVDRCTQDDVMEVDKEESEKIDPWTRTPILHPMQSTTCKHYYDKKSINCIIKNRSHFKCPYIGCQNVITKDLLIDLQEDT